jgi:queuosine precursor transporter
MIYVYLVSLTLANLLVAWLGPWVSPINAFLLIGLDLTLRDRLHDKWQGQNLSLRMGGLILAAGLLSFAINQDAGIIAVASVVAFTVSQMLDALVYQKMIRFQRWKRVNSSNAVWSWC